MKKTLIIGTFILLTFASQFEAFLNNGIGINSIAMGQAYFNIYDVESAFYNPALLSKLKKIEFQVVSNKKMDNINEIYFSCAFPSSIIDFGITYFNSNISYGITGTSYDKNTDTISKTGKSHSYFTSLLMLTLSKKIHERLFIGVNIKNFQKDLSIAEASSYALDVGFNLYLIKYFLNLSVKANNLYATEYKWETDTEKPKQEYLLGIGINMGAVKINVGSLTDYSDSRLVAGLELNYNDFMFYRLGYDKNTLSAGFSTKFSYIGIDYSYSHFLEGKELLENTHRIGFSL